MVKIDTSAHRLIQWLTAPAGALAMMFIFLGAFELGSVMMLIAASSIVLSVAVNKFANNPTTVFALIEKDNLVLKPLAYFRAKPILIPLAAIENISEQGSAGRRKFQIRCASRNLDIDLRRMLGVSFKKAAEDEFLNFLKAEIMDVEHVFGF